MSEPSADPLRVGEIVYRCQFDDVARIVKVGKGCVTFEDFRIIRTQYVWRLR